MPCRVAQYTTENGVETAVVAQIFARSIHWTRSERMQFHDGEAWGEDQSFEDFLAHGPPEIAAGLSEERRLQVERLVRGT